MEEIVATDMYRGSRTGVSPVFLGGGISGCPNWQAEMVDMLRSTDLTLLNPRRSHFDTQDIGQAEIQIAWEHAHLEMAHSILFWFPAETLAPITLFELGKWSGRHEKNLFVGAHPDYQRRIDVVVQLRLERPEIEVVDSLHALAQQVLSASRADEGMEWPDDYRIT